MTSSQERRLRWACRRGLLELDFILSRFLEHEFGKLDHRGQRAFESLLTYADNDLWHLIATPTAPIAVEHQQIVKKLREV